MPLASPKLLTFCAALLLALPAAGLAQGTSASSEIRDTARLFDAEAVREAQASLAKAERQTKVPVVIETIESLKQEPIAEVAVRRARDSGSQGIYILISKDDRAISSPL